MAREINTDKQNRKKERKKRKSERSRKTDIAMYKQRKNENNCRATCQKDFYIQLKKPPQTLKTLIKLQFQAKKVDSLFEILDESCQLTFLHSLLLMRRSNYDDFLSSDH